MSLDRLDTQGKSTAKKKFTFFIAGHKIVNNIAWHIHIMQWVNYGSIKCTIASPLSSETRHKM